MSQQLKARALAVQAAMASRARGSAGTARPQARERTEDTVFFRPGETLFFSSPLGGGTLSKRAR